MKIKVTKPKRLEDGMHQGVITDVQERIGGTWNYTDIIIESEGMKINSGYPSEVHNFTALGKLLQRFGVKLVEDEDIDINKELVGKKCQFQTMTKEVKGKGDFSNVIPETVKPLDTATTNEESPFTKSPPSGDLNLNDDSDLKTGGNQVSLPTV